MVRQAQEPVMMSLSNHRPERIEGWTANCDTVSKGGGWGHAKQKRGGGDEESRKTA